MKSKLICLAWMTSYVICLSFLPSCATQQKQESNPETKSAVTQSQPTTQGGNVSQGSETINMSSCKNRCRIVLIVSKQAKLAQSARPVQAATPTVTATNTSEQKQIAPLSVLFNWLWVLFAVLAGLLFWNRKRIGN